MTNRVLQDGAFSKVTTPECRHRPTRGSEFPLKQHDGQREPRRRLQQGSELRRRRSVQRWIRFSPQPTLTITERHTPTTTPPTQPWPPGRTKPRLSPKSTALPPPEPPPRHPRPCHHLTRYLTHPNERDGRKRSDLSHYWETPSAETR